jgi:hypothetical protein
MVTKAKNLSASALAALFLTGLTVSSQGDIGGGPSFGPGGERAVRIRGSIVCSGCSLEEARKARPHEHALYQLTHRQGQLVLQVNWVSNHARWDRIVWAPQLRVRGDDELLQQLQAEENLFKSVEITGLLGIERTLDLMAVHTSG